MKPTDRSQSLVVYRDGMPRSRPAPEVGSLGAVVVPWVARTHCIAVLIDERFPPVDR